MNLEADSFEEDKIKIFSALSNPKHSRFDSFQSAYLNLKKINNPSCPTFLLMLDQEVFKENQINLLITKETYDLILSSPQIFTFLP